MFRNSSSHNLCVREVQFSYKLSETQNKCDLDKPQLYLFIKTNNNPTEYFPTLKVHNEMECRIFNLKEVKNFRNITNIGITYLNPLS